MRNKTAVPAARFKALFQELIPWSSIYAVLRRCGLRRCRPPPLVTAPEGLRSGLPCGGGGWYPGPTCDPTDWEKLEVSAICEVRPRCVWWCAGPCGALPIWRSPNVGNGFASGPSASPSAVGPGSARTPIAKDPSDTPSERSMPEFLYDIDGNGCPFSFPFPRIRQVLAGIP
jgi:hypothetical protein